MDELELPPLLEQMGSQILGQIANSLIPGVANIFGNLFNSFLNYSLTSGGKPSKSDDKYWSINPITGEKEFNLDLYASDMADWSWQEEGYKDVAKDFSSYIQERV